MRKRCRYQRHRARTAPVPVVAPLPVVEPEPVIEDVRTLSPDVLRSLPFSAAKSYAFDAFGIKARGWDELIAEYTEARG